MPVNHVLATQASGEITHDVDEASAEHEVVRLREMLDGGPTGSTPLCAAVRRVVEVVRRGATTGAQKGDSSVLQLECLSMKCVKETIHLSRT